MISRLVTLPDDFVRIDELLRICETADTVDLDLHRHALQKTRLPNDSRYGLMMLATCKGLRGSTLMRQRA